MFFQDLPNLHPLLVHFPVALFTTAWALDLLSLLAPRDWLQRAVLLLYGLAALGAGVTALTGQLAANAIAESLSVEATHALGEHSDSAFFTVLVFFVVAGLYGDDVWRSARARSRGEIGPTSFGARVRAKLPVLVAALVGLTLIARTAGRGGALVYRYGVGVSMGEAGSER